MSEQEENLKAYPAPKLDLKERFINKCKDLSKLFRGRRYWEIRVRSVEQNYIVLFDRYDELQQQVEKTRLQRLTNEFGQMPDHPNRIHKHPGFFIQRELDERGWGPAILAKRMGRSVDFVQSLIQGRRVVTSSSAIRLGEALETSAYLWARIDADHRVWKAQQKMKETDEQRVERSNRSQ